MQTRIRWHSPPLSTNRGAKSLRQWPASQIERDGAWIIDSLVLLFASISALRTDLRREALLRDDKLDVEIVASAV